MDTLGYTILAVAPIVIPGIGVALGSAILGSSAASVGAAVGLSAAQVSSLDSPHLASAAPPSPSLSALLPPTRQPLSVLSSAAAGSVC